ncbi:MAG: hypothetical protein JWQ35_2096 [Bacteriovoracaceae bacterium]|nr:hypothetical protein [Bacteriovoracaceae bacterium]
MELDIYSYLDYRTFCRDFYLGQKNADSHFSFRSFAKKASIASSYLKHVIDGKRNLSSEMSIKFGHGMGLSSKEIDYFENLVRFTQASSLEEKDLYFERLRKKRAKSLKSLDLAEAVRLLSHWYVVAIKELVVNLNTVDVKLLQRVLRKKLPENLIEKTIEELRDFGWLNLIEGRWHSSASQVQFPDEVRSYVVRSFHGQMLELAIEALEDDISDREYGAAVFTFPASEFPKLKEKIKELQRDLIGYVQDLSANSKESSRDTKSQRVYHFGVQCFSLQKEMGHEKKDDNHA